MEEGTLWRKASLVCRNPRLQRYENFTFLHYKKNCSIYLDIAALQDFKVFLLLQHAFEDLATEKLKKLLQV